MTDTTLQNSSSPAVSQRMLERGLMLLVGAALLLKLHLLFVINVNWDEFFYLDKVYSYLRGDLSQQLQTFHVHFFAWLPHVSDNEVDQIIAARLVVYALTLLTCALTYLIGRRFLDRTCALFALLCYLALSFTVEHGTSFRADPLGAVLFLCAVFLLMPPTRSWPATIGAAFALAGALMITIKALFYLPVIGLILLLALVPAESRRPALSGVVAFGTAFLIAFAALYLWHRSTLAAPEASTAVGLVGTSAAKVIRLDDLFPRRLFFYRSLMEDVAVWVAFLLGAAAFASDSWRRSTETRQRLYLLVFLLPLTTLLFYRNAFPYYYVFILSPAVILCGVGLQRLLANHGAAVGRGLPLLAVGLVIAVSVSFGKHYLANATDRTSLQRETVDLVHRLFPEPVPYIDRSSMISSFPKVGLFMSTWGMETYLQRGEPLFRELLLRQRPVFLLANIPSLDLAVDQERLREAGAYTLMDEDFQALRENFVHHWGQLYVAGKSLDFASPAGAVDFEILIPGLYTLEAEGAVLIDDRAIGRGRTLFLERGRHRAEPLGPRLRRATLRWGDHLYRPSRDPMEGTIFTGF